MSHRPLNLFCYFIAFEGEIIGEREKGRRASGEWRRMKRRKQEGKERREGKRKKEKVNIGSLI